MKHIEHIVGRWLVLFVLCGLLLPLEDVYARPEGIPKPGNPGSSVAVKNSGRIAELAPQALKTASGAKRRVFDEAGLMSESERDSVQAELDKVSRELGSEFYVMAVKTLNGLTVERYAEDFFRKYRLGTSDGTGAMLLLAMQERDIRFATFGRAIPLYQPFADRIRSRVTPHMTARRYHDGFVLFAQSMKPASFFDKMMLAARTWKPLAVALVLTLVIVGFLAWNHRGAITVSSMTYAVPGAFRLTSSEDRYLRTTTSKSKISKSSSSSGGGGGSSGGSSGKF